MIIDEISMLSYKNLRMIHLRLQEFKNNDKLFGGVNILLFGDAASASKRSLVF